MIKEHILKYIKLNPNILYYDLCQIFGLSIEELLPLLGIVNYKIKNKYIEIYNTNNNLTYEESPRGYWVEWGYDSNGKLTSKEDSYGYCYKYYYDTNGNLMYKERYYN